MKSLKVLIVDDDPSTCSLLQTILEMEHYQIASANEIDNGDIIALLNKEQPDILTLDINLAGEQTLKYLATIRHHPDWQHLDILMISAADQAEACLEAGANGFVVKPFGWQEITTAIKQMTNK